MSLSSLIFSIFFSILSMDADRVIPDKADFRTAFRVLNPSIRTQQQSEVVMPAMEIINQKFGRLTVIGQSESIGRYAAWECKCECGNTKIVKGVFLRKGKTKSCGCLQGERKNDLLGQRFHRLLVVSKFHKVEGDKKRIHWLCKCDCGNTTSTKASHLINGNVKSCGCLMRERHTKHGHCKTITKNKRQRKSRTPTYITWECMIQRTTNPNNPNYQKYYGIRGITVCDRWRIFSNFFEDMGERPSLKHKLERRENNKGYSKDNCTWSTHKEQMNNTRRNHILEWQGKRMNIGQWAEELGINYVTLATRVQRGWPMEKIMTQPIQVRNK